MGRVSGVPVNVYTGLGDLAYGGAGTPTGYTNVATNARGVVPLWSWNNGALAFDGNDATEADPSGFAGQSLGVDLLAPFRVGRWRARQSDNGNRRATSVKLQSADASGGPWTDRDAISAAFLDSGYRDLAAPITARFWRVLVVTAGPWDWTLTTLEVLQVTTVGSGNPTRLPPPGERRVMGYDPSAGVPQWQARGAAVADLGATVGEANNAASATLVATKAEHDATRAAFNSLLGRLRDAGILAP